MDPLAIRKRLGRRVWSAPSPFGPDGWSFTDGQGWSVIVTRWDDDWVHASIAHEDVTPSYDDLVFLHRAVFEDGWAYQVFAPSDEHVNIHEHALHLFGRDDGKSVLPDFTMGSGSI